MLSLNLLTNTKSKFSRFRVVFIPQLDWNMGIRFQADGILILARSLQLT